LENNLNLGFLPDSAPSPRVEEHLTLADRQKDSLLAGWMHMVSLYPLTGWFRYPCESRASRGKPDVNSHWRETLSDVGRAVVLICSKAVETWSLVLWTRGELSQLPGWSCKSYTIDWVFLVRSSTCLPGGSRCLAGGKTTQL